MTINPRVVKAYGTLFLTQLGDLKDAEGKPIPKYIQGEEDRIHELQVVLQIREGYAEEVALYIAMNG